MRATMAGTGTASGRSALSARQRRRRRMRSRHPTDYSLAHAAWDEVELAVACGVVQRGAGHDGDDDGKEELQGKVAMTGFCGEWGARQPAGCGSARRVAALAPSVGAQRWRPALAPSAGARPTALGAGGGAGVLSDRGDPL